MDDSWRHDIVLEKATRGGKGALPAAGRRRKRLPPEDVGGISGYAYFREVLTDPGHYKHNRYVRWAGLGTRRSSTCPVRRRNRSPSTGPGRVSRRAAHTHQRLLVCRGQDCAAAPAVSI
ncbi:hypothetical protein ABZW49_05410 [Nonomuraea wenchangensis]